MTAGTYDVCGLRPSVVSSLTTEYVRVQVLASLDGVAVNPTGLTVDIAVVAAGVSPLSGDWHAAAWETISQPWMTSYEVQFLASTIAVGEYDVYLKIVDSPNVIVTYLGRLDSR